MDENGPASSAAGRDAKAARAERLARAMRENLKKRKQQARGRSERPEAAAVNAADDAGGPVD